MYLTFKIARFKFAAATKDEYLIPPDEVMLCKKGFRFSFGKHFFNCKVRGLAAFKKKEPNANV